MSTKKLAIEMIQKLPETASWDDIEERIQFLAAIEHGRTDVENGDVIPHEEVKENLAAWVTK